MGDLMIASCWSSAVNSCLSPEERSTVGRWRLWPGCCARSLRGKAGVRWSEWCAGVSRTRPPAFRFAYARMGQMVEAPSRGLLRAETTLNNIQRGQRVLR